MFAYELRHNHKVSIAAGSASNSKWLKRQRLQAALSPELARWARETCEASEFAFANSLPHSSHRSCPPSVHQHKSRWSTLSHRARTGAPCTEVAVATAGLRFADLTWLSHAPWNSGSNRSVGHAGRFWRDEAIRLQGPEHAHRNFD